MKSNLFGKALIFFISCLLIYYGAKALAEVWPILAIAGITAAALFIAITVIVKIRRSQSRW